MSRTFATSRLTTFAVSVGPPASALFLAQFSFAADKQNTAGTLPSDLVAVELGQVMEVDDSQFGKSHATAGPFQSLPNCGAIRLGGC